MKTTINTKTISRLAVPGFGAIRVSERFIKTTAKAAQASIEPNNIKDAKSPFTNRCATAQIFKDASIGWRKRPLRGPLVCPNANTNIAVTMRILLMCTKKFGGVQTTTYSADL